MRAKRASRLRYISNRAKHKHSKSVRRLKMLQRRWKPYPFRSIQKRNRELGAKNDSKRKKLTSYAPPYSSNIRHIVAQAKKVDLSRYLINRHSGNLKVPVNFSLIEEPVKTYDFIWSLFGILYKDAAEYITLDYSECQRIDLDAQVFMDVMLKDFIQHLRQCQKFQRRRRINSITPINFNEQHLKILGSIGSFSVLKDLDIKFPRIISYKLCIGSRHSLDRFERASQKELHTTQLVDYVIESLGRMHQKLTPDAKNDLSQVVGEILINAEEHGTTDYRYSIGYFEETTEEKSHYGIFNLVIFNIGQTIYEKFKDPNCPTQHIVARMEQLSEQYTKKGFFKSADFEEETLWTLYALQEGVTSSINYKKRGNGSIRFIESFFNLKGKGLFKDDISRLVIRSGNTQIVFDGSYDILAKEMDGNVFKVISFNNSGGFAEKPDKKFVNFTSNYFPGTMIVAKILIREEDIVK